jgi:hypothetical protein
VKGSQRPSTLFAAPSRGRPDKSLRQKLVRRWRMEQVLREEMAALLDENTRLQARLGLQREATSDGLWDVELGQRELTDPSNEFILQFLAPRQLRA